VVTVFMMLSHLFDMGGVSRVPRSGREMGGSAFFPWGIWRRMHSVVSRCSQIIRGEHSVCMY